MRRSWRKTLQKFLEALGVVTSAVLQHVGRVRVNQIALGIQNEDVRVSVDSRKAGQKGFVWIFLAHADFHHHVILVAQGGEVRVLVKKTIHGVTPAVPFAANDNEDSSV